MWNFSETMTGISAHAHGCELRTQRDILLPSCPQGALSALLASRPWKIKVFSWQSDGCHLSGPLLPTALAQNVQGVYSWAWGHTLETHVLKRLEQEGHRFKASWGCKIKNEKARKRQQMPFQLCCFQASPLSLHSSFIYAASWEIPTSSRSLKMLMPHFRSGRERLDEVMKPPSFPT